MKYFTANLVCFALAFAVASGSSIRDPQFQPTIHSPVCGGVLTNLSEQIIYKPFEQVDNNERCVWTIAAPSATKYEVSVLYYGFEPEQGLLNVVQLDKWTSVTNKHLVNASTTFNTNVLMITYHSPSNAAGIQGFALKYKVLSTGSKIYPKSTHQTVGNDIIDLKFPAGRTTYDENELSTFVFPPINIKNLGASSRVVVYERLGSSNYPFPNCGGRIMVFKFDPVTGLYIKKESMCRNVAKEILVLNELAIMVFWGDESHNGSGFELNVANCERLDKKQ